jgi:hypothetical protein
MRLDYAPGSGRLRLDLAAFEVLVSYARDPAATSRQARSALRTAGALSASGLHARLAPAFAAVVHPLCRLTVSVVVGDGPEQVVEGWMSSEAAALRLPCGPGRYEMVTVLPAFVPAAIARVVGLGPHRLAQAERRLWRAETTWTGQDGEKAGRAVAVADTGDGLHLVESDGGDVALSAATPTTVWRLLPLLLPADHELAR